MSVTHSQYNREELIKHWFTFSYILSQISEYVTLFKYVQNISIFYFLILVISQSCLNGGHIK